jgi:parallel beta-helix repeat protein
MFLAFGLAAVSSAQAATIVWVSFHGADDAPSDGASGAGFTEAPDKGYTDLLTANGYDVTRYITTATPDPAFLNGADLVIISRSAASNHYQNASATAWNAISAPMIILNGYTLRYNRMGYTTGNTIPDITGNITLTVNDPTHPIFAGIPLTDGTMINPYAGLATYPTDGTTAAGISINTDPVNNGTVLATISAAGNGPVGGMVIAEWQAGATLTHAGGAGTDTLAGHRLVFLTGSRESGGKNSQTAGMCDLYVDGAQMFLNAVGYMLSPPAPSPRAANPSPANGATDVPTDAVLSWTQGTGAISHHIYFGTNQADVAAGTPSTDMGTQIGTSYDPPGTLSYGTTYYWRIDEFDGATIYPGNIWSFTTTAISIPTNTSVGTWDPVTRTYTLTQDVTGSIRIDEDNLTLDGAGHRVVGPGSGDGVALFARTGVTVKNLNIQSFGNGIYIGNSSGNTLTGNTSNLNGRGIALDYSENNTLEGNNSESNTGPGINLWHSSGNNLTGNTNNSNGVGISLDNSTGNTLTGNFCESNAWCGIAIHDSSNGNTLNNNTCNSSTDYDGIGLYNSTGNTLTGNICESSKRAGIWLENSTGNTITTNTCSSNDGAGINLWGSSNNNNLIGNTNNSNNVGIDLHACDNNTLEGNNSELNTWAGINLWESSGNILTGNTNNSHNVGICLDYSIGNNLTDNTCNSSSWAGIRLYYSEKNNLTGNTNSLNGEGINLQNSTGNTLTDNTCSLNNGNGIAIWESSNNTLTGNTCNSNNDNGISLYHSQDHNLTDNIAELNAWSGIYLDNSTGNTLTGNRVNSEFAGISLGESNNNTLSHNTCSSSTWAGIHLGNSNSNSLSGNFSESNTLFGIRLDNCNGNTIYNNNFVSNPVQAYVDGGSGNVFNLSMPTGGNYWSDWTTPDGNHDHIVDSPYVFSGGQDNLPWTCQDGWLLLAIGIDIYPNRTPNMVYLSKNYTISVVVFGSANFNVTTLNSSTVRFGRTGTEATPVRAPTIRDMNADGLPDAMYGFLTFKCGFQLGNTEGILTGSTTSGILIEGRDSVVVSP